MNKERALLLVPIKASICTHHKQLERQKTKGQKNNAHQKKCSGKKKSCHMEMKIKELACKNKVPKMYTCHWIRSYNKPAPVPFLGSYLNPLE
jgi:hypothetical protein